jgi:hypothetical protein
MAKPGTPTRHATDISNGILIASRAIGEILAARQPVSRAMLSDIMHRAFGARDGSGAWLLRHAYDACEAGLVRTLLGEADRWVGAWDRPAEALTELCTLQRLLPSQTFRSETQISYQQFSTPLPLAFAAATALRGQTGIDVLEPSAGTGMLAAMARVAGHDIRLRLNELEPVRNGVLRGLLPDAPCEAVDGAAIENRWRNMTAAILNPPFARTAGVGEDRHAAARHLVAALKSLAPGGRAMAIMPGWFEPSGAQQKGYRAVQQLGRILLDLRMPGDIYQHQGTSAEVRLLILERGIGDHASPAQATLAEAIERIGNLPEWTVREPEARTPAKTIVAAPSPSRRPGPVVRPTATPVKTAEVDLTLHNSPIPAADPVGHYVPWRAARHAIEGARPHPTPLVESMAMAAVLPPPVTYRPMLPPASRAPLSEAQLETLILAGASFAHDLPGQWVTEADDTALIPAEEGRRYRQGFFLGDGTGAGKGRQVAGLIMDQWARGQRRHIWISKSAALIEDARRDWTAVGGLALDIMSLDQWPLGTGIEASQGILFLTYATLRSERPEKGSRLDQLQQWLGDGFDGLIVFDEAHAMANAAGSMGPRGRQAASEQGLAGLWIQNRNARARVLYVSATGATDVNNLAYATRLGLWGQGTAFETRDAFIEKIRQSGIAAMELVARDLKAQGLYTARALSFGGVEYDILEHRLTDSQIATYDCYAGAWQIIHRNLDEALRANGTIDPIEERTLNAQAKSAALSRFESTKQRFFAQVIMTMKLPSLIDAIEQDIAAGNAVVIQLVSTAEAMLDRKLTEADTEQGGELDFDLSPREYVMDYLMNAFPVRAMETYLDDSGTKKSRLAVNSNGEPIFSAEAIAMRDALVEQLCALPGVATALDEIIRHFGPDKVAEVTGRSRRLITASDGSQRVERRSGRANLAETDAFMSGRKTILIFSDAGGTGRSYHADLSAPNQRRRVHYLLEPGWRADNAIQGLGRTHRTHQAQPPLFRPVTTDVKGEKRFISTIARRLDSLGALTRGQRQTGGQNMFDPADNLESEIATSALNQWFRLVFQGKLQSISYASFRELSGLDLEAKDGSGALREDLPRIQQWLNRLLAFPIALQNAVFDEYLGLLEARVQALRASGRLDLGVEDIRVTRMTTLSERVVRTDPRTGAETKLLQIEIEQPRKLLDHAAFQKQWTGQPGVRLMRNQRSGRVAAFAPTRDMLGDDGDIIPMTRIIRPGEQHRERTATLTEGSWTEIAPDAFQRLWERNSEELRYAPARRAFWLLTGLLLPLWDKIPGDFVRVVRVSDGDGRSLLGRTVDDQDLEELLGNLGVEGEIGPMSGSDILGRLERGAKRVRLPGSRDRHLQTSLVNGQRRIELVGFDPHGLPRLKACGCFTEIIRFRTRVFVQDEAVLDRLIAMETDRVAA